MSRIVILVGSLRKGGNTELLAGAFAEGAGLHNKVEVVSVADYSIHPCTGCNRCFPMKTMPVSRMTIWR